MKLHRVFYSRDGGWRAGAAVESEARAVQQAMRLFDRWAVCEDSSGAIGPHVNLDQVGREFIAAWCCKRAAANGRVAGAYRASTGKGRDIYDSPYTCDALAEFWRDGFEKAVTP